MLSHATTAVSRASPIVRCLVRASVSRTTRRWSESICTGRSVPAATEACVAVRVNKPEHTPRALLLPCFRVLRVRVGSVRAWLVRSLVRSLRLSLTNADVVPRLLVISSSLAPIFAPMRCSFVRSFIAALLRHYTTKQHVYLYNKHS